ncbi:MAG TPA: hypothetical protein VIM12_02340 [Noviherbaspirillum sp.]|jgi:hypothetical protein|uniref:hypothetical protein n=1 Tax=Noviherbaspirillum sp. TaxID=1926288 RepID=UPI002F9251F0
MQDNPGTNAGGEAKRPIGRTPRTGSDSGDAQVPGGAGNGTGNRGVAGIGTAGGTTPEAAPASGQGNEARAPEGDPNKPGTAGDYSR